MLRLEADPERTAMVADMAGEVVADLEDHEVVMVAVIAVLWVLLLHLEIGDVVRDPMRTVVEVVAVAVVAVAAVAAEAFLYLRSPPLRTPLMS